MQGQYAFVAIHGVSSRHAWVQRCSMGAPRGARKSVMRRPVARRDRFASL
jgi:hypothetical protein